MSFSDMTDSNAEFDESMRNMHYENISKIKRELEIQSMIKQIELKAEVKIPDYVEIQYIEYMYDLALEFEIPIRTAFRLVFKESSFIDTIVSPKGAYGFMQLMPKTFEMYRDILNFRGNEISDNHGNIYIGFYLLKELYDYWSIRVESDEYAWALALASYNAGMGRVRKYKGIPPFKETINYIDFILREHSNPEQYGIYLANYENPNKNGT